MRAIIMKHGEDPELRDIENSTETMQEIVGGDLEMLPMAEAVRRGMLMFSNKYLRENPGYGIPNRAATFFFSGMTNTYLSRMDPRVVCGNALIVGVNEGGEFTDLTDHQLRLISIVSSEYLKWDPLKEVQA